MDTVDALKALIVEGEWLAHYGGTVGSGYSQEKQSEFYAWKITATTTIKELGAPTEPILKDLEKHARINYLYRSSVEHILGALNATAPANSPANVGSATSGKSATSAGSSTPPRRRRMLYLITYQLDPGAPRNISQVVQNIEQTITSLGGDWWHYIPGTWIVNTNLTAEQIAGSIHAQMISERDRLFITAVQAPMYGWLPAEAWTWLNERLYPNPNR